MVGAQGNGLVMRRSSVRFRQAAPPKPPGQDPLPSPGVCNSRLSLSRGPRCFRPLCPQRPRGSGRRDGRRGPSSWPPRHGPGCAEPPSGRLLLPARPTPQCGEDRAPAGSVRRRSMTAGRISAPMVPASWRFWPGGRFAARESNPEPADNRADLRDIAPCSSKLLYCLGIRRAAAVRCCRSAPVVAR
jgi:hypothetical protein